MEIYFDIETIPGQTPGLREMIAQNLSPPANIKKEETLAAWYANELPVKAEEAYLKTALDGTLGEIACMSWAFGQGSIEHLVRGIGDSEADMLQAFYDRLAQVTAKPGQPRRLTWVGHNVKEFDLRFVFQRSVILRVAPSVKIPHDVHPSSDEVFDTMTAWAGFRNTVKLDVLCHALGIPGKVASGMDGSQVWPAILAGELEKVAMYCDDDVDRVRKIHARLTFMGHAVGNADQALDRLCG